MVHIVYQVSSIVIEVISSACLLFLLIQAYWDRRALFKLLVKFDASKFVVHRCSRLVGIAMAFAHIIGNVDYYKAYGIYSDIVTQWIRAIEINLGLFAITVWMYFTLKPLYPFLFKHHAGVRKRAKYGLGFGWAAVACLYFGFQYNNDAVYVVIAISFVCLWFVLMWALNIALWLRLKRRMKTIDSESSGELSRIMRTWARNAFFQSLAVSPCFVLMLLYVVHAFGNIGDPPRPISEREFVDPDNILKGHGMHNLFANIFLAAFSVLLLFTSWRQREKLEERTTGSHIAVVAGDSLPATVSSTGFETPRGSVRAATATAECARTSVAVDIEVVTVSGAQFIPARDVNS